MKSDEQLVGLSGWLAVVGFLLIATPLRMLINIEGLYAPFLIEGVWDSLTSPGSPYYHPIAAPVMVIEAILNTFFLAAFSYLVYLYFGKNHRFPAVFVGVVVANAVFQWLDAFVVSVMVPDLPMFDAQTTPGLLAAVVAVVVWVPYVLKSKRVRLTFVEGQTSGHEEEAA